MSYSELGFNLPMPNVPTQFWPDAEVNGAALYTFDATDIVTFHGTLDPIVGASVSTRPSGSGEITPSSIAVVTTAGRVYVNVKLSGGVSTRNYIHQLIITTQSGQVLPVIIGQVCDPVLAIPPIPPPQSPVFGTSVIWP